MKCLLRLAIITTIAFLMNLTPALSAKEYDHMISLDRMSFEWKLEATTIKVRLKARTKGWVAVGFNPTKGMAGANFIIGYVKRGKVKIQDEYGIRPQEHITDIKNNGTNDIKDVSGSESFGRTTIAFTIPLNSSDPNDTVLNPKSPVTVLLAFGPNRDNFFVKHIYRTALTVDLKSGRWRR